MKYKEEKKDIKNIEKFIKENLVKADNSGAACPDGRYTINQDNGWIRLFGAHLGVFMAVMASLQKKSIVFSPKEAFLKTKLALLEIIGSEIKLQAHTDDHKNIGCGHIEQAASGKYEDLYEINAKFALFIWEEAKKDKSINWVTLEGGHKEKGVLFIKSESFTVHSQDKKQEEMYFVIDVLRTNELLTKFGQKINIKGIKTEDIIKNYWKQAKATSLILAKGLPQFEVKIDKNGNFYAEFLGPVE